MSGTLEERVRQSKPDKLVQIFAGDMVELLDARDAEIAGLRRANIKLREACKAGGDPGRGGGYTDGPHLLEKAAQILGQHDYVAYLVHCLQRKAKLEREALDEALETVSSNDCPECGLAFNHHSSAQEGDVEIPSCCHGYLKLVDGQWTWHKKEPTLILA